MKRILIILMSFFSAINAGQLEVQKFPSHYKISSKEFNGCIPNYMVSKRALSMKPETMVALLESKKAYLDINECSDGLYSMDIKGRVKGGGPITASVLYGLTKIGLYGTAAAAAGTAIAATGGAASAALGFGAAGAAAGTATGVATLAAGAAVESVAAGGAIAIAGSTISGAGTVIGMTVAGAGAEMALVGGTTAAITSVGGVGAAIAAVESASMGAFAFGMMLPLP